MSDLETSFSKLSSNQKAMFLVRVAHAATISAREAYIPDYDKPDGLRLQNTNEFVHRVTGYIPHVLDGTQGKEQDASVIKMIEGHFGIHSREFLTGLLGNSN